MQLIKGFELIVAQFTTTVRHCELLVTMSFWKYHFWVSKVKYAM